MSALELFDGQLTKAVINDVEEARHFFAAVELRRGDDAHLLSCRPSDAIALAVRVPGAGLYATEEVMAAAGRYPRAPGPMPPRPLPLRSSAPVTRRAIGAVAQGRRGGLQYFGANGRH